MRLIWLYAMLAVFLFLDFWAFWILARALLGNQKALDLEFKLRVDNRVSTTGKRPREARYAKVR